MRNQLLPNPASVLPFLKWPGGKRWLVADYPDWFKVQVTRHIEPFLGGGAVFFHRRPDTAILTDSNAELIETYRAVKSNPVGVAKLLKDHHNRHTSEHYYLMRNRACRTQLTKASRFIYLNRTCFNGIYRVNLEGAFNVPIGTKTNVVLPTDNFESVSRLLSAARLDACSFEKTISLSGESDFLYLDPPYTVKHNNNNFLKYNEHIFSWADQVKLAEEALKAARRGAHVLISNADHKFVRELYRDPVWRQMSVNRFSILASSSDRRRLTTELVVSNFIGRDAQVEGVRT